jgi:hypothetical protein
MVSGFGSAQALFGHRPDKTTAQIKKAITKGQPFNLSLF